VAAWIRTVGKGNIWQKAANTVELKDIDGKSRVAATLDDIMLTFDFNIMTARAGLCGTRSDKPKVQHRNCADLESPLLLSVLLRCLRVLRHCLCVLRHACTVVISTFDARVRGSSWFYMQPYKTSPKNHHTAAPLLSVRYAPLFERAAPLPERAAPLLTALLAVRAARLPEC